MLRRLLLLAFVALAVFGLYPAEYLDPVPAADPVAAAAPADAGCCPCADDGLSDDGCCTSASCACASAPAALPARFGMTDPRAVADDATWALGAEQQARDRSSAPPTRPPIG